MRIKRKRLDEPPDPNDLGPMRHYNQRYAFVSAARLDASSGVGTSPLALGLLAALARKGKKVALVVPPPTLRLPSPWLERWFNRRVAGTLAELATDVSIGFDGDGYRFARASGRTAFVCFVAQDPPWHDGSVAGARDRFQPARIRAAARAADLVIATSRYAEELIVEACGVPPARIARVSPGIEIDEWTPRTLPVHDRPRVLAVAHNAGPADWGWLLEGCVQARRQGLDLQLQVCGARRPDTWLKKAHRSGLPLNAVHVDARWRRSELKAELGAADAFVQIARCPDGAPHILWAMALGRPVIVPASGPASEWAGSAAHQVPAFDAAALGAALAEVLADRNGAEAWALRGVARAGQFAWDEQARIFGELLAEL